MIDMSIGSFFIETRLVLYKIVKILMRNVNRLKVL